MEDSMEDSDLQSTIDKGSWMLELMKSRGFQEVLHPWLQGKINDNKNIWLTAGQEEAENIRIKSKVYLEIYQFINSTIQVGRVAEEQYKQFKEDGIISSNQGDSK
jgi:hypothetical protein